MAEARATHCDWDEDCRQPAVYVWHAQWTVVDFDDYYACQDHYQHVGDALARRTVDGLAVQDLWAEELGDG